MSYLLFLILLCLVLEYMDLLCLAVLNDIGGYGSALNIRSSCRKVFAGRDCKNPVKGNGFSLADVYCFPPVSITANTKSTSLSNAESDRRLADTGKPGKTGFL